MLTDYQDSCSRVSDFGLSWNCRSIVYLSSQDELCIPQLSCLGFQLRYTSRRSSPPLFVHPLHLNCVLLDTGGGCASPLSIDGVAFWCCYLVDFKGFNGPSRTNGARPLQVGRVVIFRHQNKQPNYIHVQRQRGPYGFHVHLQPIHYRDGEGVPYVLEGSKLKVHHYYHISIPPH